MGPSPAEFGDDPVGTLPDQIFRDSGRQFAGLSRSAARLGPQQPAAVRHADHAAHAKFAIGDIGIDSQEDEGTTVTITLPLEQQGGNQ